MSQISRLDRLFQLLESGTSKQTRLAAAKQFGRIQQQHRHELHSLLARLIQRQYANNWETRIATAEAIRYVLEELPNWKPAMSTDAEQQQSRYYCRGGECRERSECVLKHDKLLLNDFDLNECLQQKSQLFGSKGSEFDYCERASSDNERIQNQRKRINETLGLDLISNSNSSELISLSDLTDTSAQPQPQQQTNLSSRELNRAKRKARQADVTLAAQTTTGSSLSLTHFLLENDTIIDDETETVELPQRKRSKIDMDKLRETYGVPDATNNWPLHLIEWPLQYFCDRLVFDLFAFKWETRHGAAIALQQVLRCHGQAVAKFANLTAEQQEDHHQQWLENLVVRILYILALDRFGDFLLDSVVAPVRESSAQCLATIVPYLSTGTTARLLRKLLEFTAQNQWEVRHGGLLGIKYVLAVQMADSQQTFELCDSVIVPHICECLSDRVDDVAATAAYCLIPLTDRIAGGNGDRRAIETVFEKLCRLLREPDELASACTGFMELLAKLIAYASVQQTICNNSFLTWLPYLVPFLWHNATSVRKCCLDTFGTIAEHLPLDWTSDILQLLLRHLYQVILFEQNHDLQLLAERVWQQLISRIPFPILLETISPYLSTWLVMVMYSPKYPIDANLLIVCDKNGDMEAGAVTTSASKYFIGGPDSISLEVRETNAVRARLIACRMLGFLSVRVTRSETNPLEAQQSFENYIVLLRSYLNSKSAMQRTVIGLVLAQWAAEMPEPLAHLPPDFQQDLIRCLNEFVYFDEIAAPFTQLVQEYRDFVATLRHHKLDSRTTSDIFESCSSAAVLTLSRILKCSGDETKKLIDDSKLKAVVIGKLEERRQLINQMAVQTNQEQLSLSITSLSTIAGAVVMFDILPEKLNPVVKPLMESLKRETNREMQVLIANFLAKLIRLCEKRDPSPNTKIICNLVGSVTMQSLQTLQSEPACGHDGIWTLVQQQQQQQQQKQKQPELVANATQKNPIVENSDGGGPCLALQTIARCLGDRLPVDLPRLWQYCYNDIIDWCNRNNCSSDFEVLKTRKTDAELLVSSLRVIEVIVDSLTCEPHRKLFDEMVPLLCTLLQYPVIYVRHMSAVCLAICAKRDPYFIIEQFLEKVFVCLEEQSSGSETDVAMRQGVVETIFLMVRTLGIDIVPFIVIFLVPLLGRMSDANDSIRLLSAQTFAKLVQLLPLDDQSHCISGSRHQSSSSLLAEKRARDWQFVEQLRDPKRIPDYELSIRLENEISLRSYQQAGLNWLAFLNRYGLHGILCDDMGLGKTLQSICMLASHHSLDNNTGCPSLVICPATLTGHWVYEIKKFVSSNYLRPLQYSGSPGDRLKLRKQFKDHNVIITSYETLRKDIDFFGKIHWNYCVLDEGHVIKNSKTRISIAIKSLKSNHRLLLSGTPIQNNVLELWSLFDFLMPGFLGTEKHFFATFSRPILQSRDPKCSQRDYETGLKAMEQLHRQVLPFLLRRMKEDVLDDLPPKITQDYYCELTVLQHELYEDFKNSQAHEMLQKSIDDFERTTNADESRKLQRQHVFQAMHYLQNVCNHPKLVLNANHPKYTKIMDELRAKNQNLNSFKHSAKLLALHQLLRDCNIGVSPSNETTTPANNAATFEVTNQHRALIFCQTKAMLTIIEQDLFEREMPNVTHLRLDGSVALANRQQIVNRFNSDPSIDCLLLTTHVGGLGLNLTGADTVIFVEHDWNPMKDLQAMDRAHRIGQKKVVNVYRLITHGTLEENIMGLQKFKIRTANTVVSSENKSMETMGTEQLFDLFALNNGKSETEQTAVAGGSGSLTKARSISAILNNLPDLWDSNQYENEYNLDQFLAKIRPQSSPSV